MSELPTKSKIVFMVSADKEINGTKMFILPWKHELFNYSSGHTDNRNTLEIYTRFSLLVLAEWFLLLYPEGFLREVQFVISSTQNSETQELQMS